MFIGGAGHRSGAYRAHGAGQCERRADGVAVDDIGFSACVSLGNQSDLEICDFLDYFIDDPATDALCVYIEGLRDPARFVRAAAACRRAGKPMVVLKTGKTDDGVRVYKSA